MALLTRDDILKASDYDTAIVACPEWGGDVRVRGLTTAQFQRVMGEVGSESGAELNISMVALLDRGMLVKIAAWSIVNDEGKREFTDADVDRLGGKSFAPIMRIASKAMELSGLSGEQAAADVADPKGDSSSDSPPSSAAPLRSLKTG